MAAKGGRKLGVSLLKKSVHDLLLLAHKFLAFLETVRLTFDVDHRAVMQDTVQDSGGNGNVGEDLVPLGKGFVGSEDGGGFLVPPGNQLEEQICPLNVHGEIADFVDNQHPVLGQHFEKTSTVFTSNKTFSQWNEVFADVTIASAILDRVLHHCTVINIKGESYRLKERKEFMRQKQQIVNTLFEQGNAYYSGN